MKSLLFCLVASSAILAGVQATDDTSVQEIPDVQFRSCNFLMCNLQCKMNQFDGGFCIPVVGLCQCYKNSPTQKPPTEPAETEPAETEPAKPEPEQKTALSQDIPDVQFRSCNFLMCNLQCKMNQFDGGFCIPVVGLCQCYKNSPTQKPPTEPAKTEPKKDFVVQHSLMKKDGVACDDEECKRDCIKSGWKGGICQGKDCWCWRNRNLEKLTNLQ